MTRNSSPAPQLIALIVELSDYLLKGGIKGLEPELLPQLSLTPQGPSEGKGDWIPLG